MITTGGVVHGLAEIVGSMSLPPSPSRGDDGSVKPTSVVVVAYDGCQSLDVSGPVEVLARAGVLAGRPYDIKLATVGGRPARATSGLTLVPDVALERARGPVDTLVVVGGDGVRTALHDQVLLASVRRLARRARRVTSVCSGAFVLAEARLLDGRRATTHWSSVDLLAERYPAVTVEGDPIFVRDGNVWTSAGVTAGMDLALALAHDDFGSEVALETARALVMYVQRPGGQSQFSAALRAQAPEREPLREVQEWLTEHLSDDLSVAALAGRAAMSPRNFARAFAREVGVTPARYVEDIRLEAARRLLETTLRPVDDVATNCGFGTTETMRRVFARRLGVSPADYRKHFRKEPA
jgi:transcriptional regulator GlxA family with amidase domain